MLDFFYDELLAFLSDLLPPANIFLIWLLPLSYIESFFFSVPPVEIELILSLFL